MNEGLYASWLGLAGIPREAETIPLERDLALARLTGGAYHAAKISTAAVGRGDRPRQGRRRAGHGRRVDQQSVAQRERRRRVPHLLPAGAAAARRRRPAGDDRGAARTARSTSSCPRTTRRTSTPSACPLPMPRPARSGWRRCSPRRCGCITMATCRCCGWSRRCPPRRQDCSACRAARWRPAPRPTSSWSISTSPGSCSESRHPLALQEHLLRGRAAAGQGLANHGCGPHSIFGLAGLTQRERSMLRNTGRAGVRLSARLDPVRPADHPCRRARRRPQDRLRQYRRDQRAAHRQQGAGRANACARCAEGHRRRADRRLVRRRARRSMPGSPPSSATSFRPGSISRAARASPPISACSPACTGRRRCSSPRSGWASPS